MGAPIIQIHYDQIDQLVQRFAKQQHQVQAILQSLKQSIQLLENGGWSGDTASACFQEFHANVVPAYDRLNHVFSESQIGLNQLANIFHEAEAEAAALFRGELAFVAQQTELITDSNPPEQVNTPTIEQFLQWLQAAQQIVAIATIRLIPVEFRQVLLNNQTVLQAIRALPGMLPQIIIAGLLEGSLAWSAASLVLTDGQFEDQTPSTKSSFALPDTRNFAQLINSLIADQAITDQSLNTYAAVELPQASQWNMNCWEAVLYIGLLSGDLTLAELDQIYTNVATKISQAGDNVEDQKLAANQELAQSLGYNPAQIWSSGSIEAGNIVFFVSDGNPLSHVAMATGRMINGSPELISLWDRPNGKRTVQFTTIADLIAPDTTVTYAANPWLNDQ